MKHLLDIPEYDARAFLPEAGRMRLFGGKSAAPEAPDYIGQANATAAGNLNAARAQTTANRIDQITPYGQIKYTQGEGFDQAGYDAAVAKYKGDQAALDASPNGSLMRQYLKKIGQEPAMPDRTQFITNPDKWSSRIELSDTGQQLLDADSRTRLQLAGLQGSAADRVAAMLGNNDLNANTGMAGWDRVTDLIRQRQNPELDRQQAALDTKLANQGLTAGSEGWSTGQSQFGKQRADADVSAQLAGAQLQNQFFQQSAYLRNAPINELNAIRSGSSVTNPTFSTPGQQGQTSGPDLMGAQQGSYNAAVGVTNANNAAAASNTQAGIGLAGLAVAAFF